MASRRVHVQTVAGKDDARLFAVVTPGFWLVDRVCVKATKAELAAIMGLGRTSVVELLGRLAHQRLLAPSCGSVQVLDAVALRAREPGSRAAPPERRPSPL